MSKMFVQLISLSFLISNLYNTLNSVFFFPLLCFYQLESFKRHLMQSLRDDSPSVSSSTHPMDPIMDYEQLLVHFYYFFSSL